MTEGYKLGFTGGGEFHDGHVGFTAHDGIRHGDLPFSTFFRLRYRCGLTGAVMDALDRKSLIRALRERHTYATTGERILMDFSGNETPMGGTVSSGRVHLKMEVHACGTIAEIAVIKNGSVAYSRNNVGLDFIAEYEDMALTGDFYYLRVTQEDGNRAWSSPIWAE